jgi:O-antigen/teichoic acid export membrane protein
LIYAVVPDLVAHVIGNKWSPIVPLVRILVLAGFVRSFAALAGFYFYGVGRPDLNLKMNLPRLVGLCVLVWPFTAAWGLEGTSLAVLVSLALTLPIWFFGMKALAGLGPSEVLADNALSIVASALLALISLGLRPQFPATAVGAAAWLIVALLAWCGALWLLGRVSPYSFFKELARLRGAARSSA